MKEEIAWLEATKVDNTTLKVSCQKNEGKERSGQVTATIEGKSAEITVKQKADTAPSFGEKTIADQAYEVSQLIPARFLPEATGGNGTLTYSLTKQDGSALPAWLMFTTDTRLLEGTTPAAAVGAEAYIYKVSDSDGDEAMLTFMIAVEADVQSQPLGTLSTDTYTISSSEATNASLVLDVSFETEAAEWWITGANGATIPTFTSASPASDSKTDVSSRTFTYSIGANSTGTALPVSLELHISGETGGASLTMLPFTVTQGTQQITALLPVSFSVAEASAGSHTRTFTSLTLTGSATHWWLTGDASLPPSVSLSPDKDDKKVPGTTTFTVTLPRNETAQARTYTLIFHAGSSVTPSAPALDVRSFTVTQPARLASVASDVLGSYHALGGDLTVDLSDAGTGLSLTFEDTSGDYWWISNPDGTTSFSSGLTNVSPSETRAQTDVSTLSFTLSPCTGTSDCSYDLMLNIATGMSAEATDQIPFTLTQSKALGSLSTMNYSLTSGLASGETLTFTGLTFASEASEWWITGADGAAITAPLSSVSPDESSKAMLDQSDLPDGFTYSIGANAGVAREIALEIQIAAVAGEAPLTTLPFTLTQDGTTLGVLATIEDTISADGATDATYIFKGLVLNSGTHWWITKANGVAIGNSDLITNVRPDNANRRAHDGDKSFTYTSSDNTGNDMNIDLEIQIAPSAGADATITLDFTMTQSKPLISAVGTNNDIASADPGTYTVTFDSRMFATGTTHWWITGNSADRSLPAGVSVNVDAESKALASVATFDITVPDNPTIDPKTFTLLLHAGTSGLAEEPSLHAETFDVVQAGKLVTLGDDTYEIDADAQATAEVDFASQLSLRSDMTHWWITAAGGSAANTITGITSVSHHPGNRQDKGTNSFTINVSQNPTVADRDFMLTLHVGKSLGASQGSVPFTVTQAGYGVALSTANYDILPAANPSVSIDFEGLKFNSEINYWWVTARDGSAASAIEGITGVSHDGSTVSKSLATSTTSFTMNVSRNAEATDRVFSLALQVGESAGTSEGSVPFTVTQEAGAEVTLSDDTYEIAAEANSSAEVNFGNAVKFKSGIDYWWVMARDGDAASTIDGIRSVSRNFGTRQEKDPNANSFTINVAKNPTLEDRDFMLTLHVGGSSGDSQGSVPFTVTQEASEAVTLSTTNYTIPAKADAEALVRFSGVQFTGITHFWVTGRNGLAASDISGIMSVSIDGTGSNRHTGVPAFTMDVSQNPNDTDRVFMLTFHAGGSSGNSQGSVDFTVTQLGALPAGLIPVSSREQLDAIRYDLDGNGKVNLDATDANATAYTNAFPRLVSSNAYTGYRLTTNLDLGGSSSGWTPIGRIGAAFTGWFTGRGHTISNLYVRNASINSIIGLFGVVEDGIIEDVGLINPEVIGGLLAVAGSLVGRQNLSKIRDCYVSGGVVRGGNSSNIGGLVGRQNSGTIRTCYVKGGSSNGGTDRTDIGGLVGYQLSSTIRACYVFNRSLSGGSNRGSLIGNQAGGELIASYAGGKNYTNLKGTGSGTVTNSYYRRSSSSGNGKTETELKAKTNATAYNSGSIYENWNLNLDGSAATKDPWDFGDTAGGAYPKLKVDFDGNGTPTVSEFGSQ